MPSERRTTGAFALFEYGYRPFFLLAALHGVVLVPVWMAAVFGRLALPVEMEVSWHPHQTVYGFAAAGLAGFMLTAVPNWTGAPPLRGAPPAALALLWPAGRLAMTLTTVFPPRVAAGIDLAFIPALALGDMDLLMGSGIAWAVGFALFRWIYTPILVTPRPFYPGRAGRALAGRQSKPCRARLRPSARRRRCRNRRPG